MTESNRTCILIAESDVLVRNLIGTILNKEGYFVLAAANDVETLELSRTYTGNIRLLVTARTELAEAIIAERPTTRVILMSADICLELNRIIERVDPGGFLQDAALPSKLYDAIRRALASD